MHDIHAYDLEGETVWTVVAGGRDLSPGQPCRTPDELADLIRELAEAGAIAEATRQRLMRHAAEVATQIQPRPRCTAL